MSNEQAEMSYGLAQFQQGKALLDGNWISKAEADEIWRARRAPSSNQQARQRPAPEDSSVRKITGTIERPTE